MNTLAVAGVSDWSLAMCLNVVSMNGPGQYTFFEIASGGSKSVALRIDSTSASSMTITQALGTPAASFYLDATR